LRPQILRVRDDQTLAGLLDDFRQRWQAWASLGAPELIERAASQVDQVSARRFAEQMQAAGMGVLALTRARPVKLDAYEMFSGPQDITSPGYPDLPDFSLSLASGGKKFGEIQRDVDRFARDASLLIKDIGDKAARDIELLVQDAVYRGTMTSELSQQIEGILSGIMQDQQDKVQARAALIARDQIGKLNGNINRTRQEAAGLKRYRWRTNMDGRQRPEHSARNGQIFSWDKPPADGHPGQAVLCRCGAEPVFEEDDFGLTPEELAEEAAEIAAYERTQKRLPEVKTHKEPGAAKKPKESKPKPPKVEKPKAEPEKPKPPKAEVKKPRAAARPSGQKPEPSVQQNRFWDSETPVGKWHDASFKDAPDDIKAVIQRQRRDPVVLRTPNENAYALRGRHIEMDGLTENTPIGQAVWRHEYGHWVDYDMSQGKQAAWSQGRKFTSAMLLDEKSLLSTSSRLTESRLNRLRDFVLSKKPNKRSDLLRFMAKKADLDYDSLMGWIEKTAIGTLKDEAEKTIRIAQVIEAIGLKDAQGFLDGIELVTRFKGSPSIIESSERKLSFNLGMGNISDLFSATTSKRIEGGASHALSYYLNHPEKRQRECFANLFDLISDDFGRKVAETFVPNMLKEMKAALRI
jgi:SPP1 gp7 family putative phage head morphogenesis protein